MVSPTRKREAVTHVQNEFYTSQRNACRVLHQPRSTQRYESKVKNDEAELVKQMHEHVRQHPRYGYRRVCALLRADGWRVNRKRVHRLWKREHLRVPQKRRKTRRLGHSKNGVRHRRVEHKDHVWAWDFVHDRDEKGRPLKWFALIDEFTRENLALEVERSIPAASVIDILCHVLLTRGVPEHIRSDNGPEFIANEIRSYLETSGIDTLYIEPGSP